MWLWSLRVLLRVFLARVMFDQCKHNHSLHTFDLVRDFSGSLFLDTVFWLFKYVRDGAN